jgi:DNA-binding transcriptional MerR regulator/methylmalonyl-CoA mutase cobalamin-binding subunit
VLISVYHAQTMYNIKQAAARAGVSVPVLRAWERRYGIVAPLRTSSGYRQFDDEAVARVRRMRTLVETGWSPSAAAAAIIEGRVGVTDAASSEGAGRPGVPVPATEEAFELRDDARQLGGELVGAAAAMDARRVDHVLDDLFSRGSFERVATTLLFPALQQLGDAWAAGAVSVAGEHLASNAVLRRLGLALDAAGFGDGAGGRVLVGLPPGGRHELGALAFAVAARRAGVPVAYLGPDLPVADWVSAADGARAAVIGVVTARDRKGALEVARALQAAQPGMIVAFGGRGAPETDAILHLDDPLPASVATLQEALAASG